LRDPFDWKQKKECDWYLHDYLQRYPYSTTRARKVASLLKGYARDLQGQLKLNEFIPVAGNDASSDRQVVVLEIEEGQLDDSTSENTVHQLYWELLEELDVWDRRDLDVRIHRSSCGNGSVSRGGIKRIQSWSHRVHSLPSLNILLVVARNLKKRTDKYNDVSPWVISGILGKIQRAFDQSRTSVRINIEIVRPGTLDALENHLARSDELHGPGYFHVVHFDMHGKVGSRREGSRREPKAAYLRFCDPESDGTISVDARVVGKILRRHNVLMVILNACESAKANSGDDSNIAKILSRGGVQNILAMSFKASEAAVEVFFGSFYWNFMVKHLNFSAAASSARDELRKSATRYARFNLKRPLLDWFVPVVYTSGPPLVLASDVSSTGTCENAMPKSDIFSDHELIGRDFDILRVEKALLKRPEETQVDTMQALYLYGIPGVGKSAFLKYLSALWKNTSFIDAAIYIDFESRHLQSVDDFVSEIIAQLPPAPNLNSDSHPQVSLEKMPADLGANEKLNTAMMLLARLNVAIILDGLQLLTIPSLTLRTGHFLSSSVIKGINEILQILGDLKAESPERRGPFFIFSGRHEKPPTQIACCANAATYELSPLEPRDSEEIFRYSLSGSNSSAEYSHATSVDIQNSELLASLLQRIPAALVHFADLSRTLYYSTRELYDLLHAGHTQEWLEAGHDGNSSKIFKELKCFFNTTPRKILSPMLMIGWYWHEGPSISSFSEALISAKVCKDASEVTTAVQLASDWGYIKVGGSNEIEWIHPLFTIACRIFVCALLELPPITANGSWGLFRKAFGCDIMGHGKSLRFDDCRLIVESADGLQAVVLLLTSALGANPLRDLNLQYFTFVVAFLRGINLQKAEMFMKILGKVKVPEETPDNILSISLESGFQNILFAIEICLGRGRVCLPSSIWPNAWLQLHGGVFVKIGSLAQIRLLAEHYERLLGRLLSTNHVNRGKFSFTPDELHVPLSLALSLTWIHRQHLPSLSNNYQRFIDLAWNLLETSEAEFGATKNSVVLSYKSFMSILKAEVIAQKGHELEADKELKRGLSFGRQAIRSGNDDDITSRTEKAGPFDEYQEMSNAFMESYLEQLGNSWDPYKAYVRGDIPNVTQQEETPSRGEDEVGKLFKIFKVDRPSNKIRDHHLEPCKFDAIENATNYSGNWATSLLHHQDLARTAVGKLDFAKVSEHGDAILKILEKETPTSDKIRPLQIVQASLLNENSYLTKILDSSSSESNSYTQREYLESVKEAEASMREAGLSGDIVRSFEVFRESIVIGNELTGESDDERLVLPKEVKNSAQSILQKHLYKCQHDQNHFSQIAALLLDLQVILRDLDVADINHDMEESIRLLARLDEISQMDDFSDLVNPEYVEERRVRVLHRNLKFLAGHLETVTKASDMLEARILLQNCIGCIERYSLTEYISIPEDTDLLLIVEHLHLHSFVKEANEALDSQNYSKVLEISHELSAHNEAGSFWHSEPDLVQETLNTIYPLGLRCEIELALRNRREEDDIDRSKEWESSTRWRRAMETPMKSEILDLRDFYVVKYHMIGLLRAGASAKLSEAFDHLHELTAVHNRQQLAEEFADARCPKLKKTMLDFFSRLLMSEGQILVRNGKEVTRAHFSETWHSLEYAYSPEN